MKRPPGLYSILKVFLSLLQVDRSGCQVVIGRIVGHSGWPFIPGLDTGIFSGGWSLSQEISSSFRYSKGMLYLANEYALMEDGAALLIIDEINRGPAVESFGDTIVSLEADKRLDENDERRAESFPIQLPDDAGELGDYYFSDHLYLLAAMNAADASVAPMDVAFLRRWAPVRIFPDPSVARFALGLSPDPGEDDGDSKKLLQGFGECVGAGQQANLSPAWR